MKDSGLFISNQQLVQRARGCLFCRPALRDLALRLPPEDQALDQILAEIVRDRDEIAFTHLLLAALSAGRPVDAHHLVLGASLLADPGLLASVVPHLKGDVTDCLLKAVEGGAMGWEREAVVLLLAADWW